MQVVLQTPSEMVVHDSRWSLVAMGSIFSAIGFGFIWLRISHPDGWSGNGGPWVVYVVGGLFGIVGLLIIHFSADRRYIIDRSAKKASIVVQRLVHRTTTALSFDDIDDVALEQSQSMQQSGSANKEFGSTYRVVFMMKDGSRVPWTPYSSSARESQETCAAAVRTFGGWSGRPDHPVPPSIAAPSLISHPAATNWGCFAALMSLFVAVGLGIFSLQVFKIITYEPIEAKVYSNGVKEVKGSKGGSTYAPMVSYGYYKNGVAYYSTAVNPIQISASLTWANNVVKQFPPGSVVTAYVSPSHPERAFLIRRASLIPLFFVVIPVLFTMLFMWSLRMQRNQVVFAEKHLVPVVAARG